MSKRAARPVSARNSIPLGPELGPELPEQEDRRRIVIRLASVLYWESDAEHRITRVVSGSAPGEGQEPRAHVGHAPWELPSTRPDAAGWAAQRATQDAHKAFRDFEFARLGSDRAERHYRISGEPRFGVDGTFLGYHGISENITGLKRAAATLRESEDRFRSLVELSADWYWEQDAELRFTRFEGVHVSGGGGGEELIGKRRWESKHKLDIEGGWDAHRALLAARKPFRDAVMRRTLPDGNFRYLSSSGEPQFDAGGGFCGYCGVGRDVTEQKRGEELIRLEHAVARCLADTEDAPVALQQVMREICETQEWQCGRYLSVDDAAGRLRFGEFWCLPGDDSAALLPKLRRLTYGPGVGLVGSAWQAGQPLWIPDIHRDPRTRNAVFSMQSGTKGLFVFPVTAAARTIGVFAFNSRNVREPDQRLLQAARVIGSQVGQFLRRKRAEEVLRVNEERFRSLTKMSSDFYWETDAEHRFTTLVYGHVYSSTQPRNSQLGKTRWEIPSTRPDAAGWAAYKAQLDAHQPYRDFEFSRARPDGSEGHFLTSGEPRFAADGTFLGYRGIGRNVTELVEARRRIAQLAYSDPLTGLANRTSFGPALERAVNRTSRYGGKLALIFVDLDGFKAINDTHGHAAGDRLLIEAAGRMRAALRASDLVARLGGDEFVVLLEDVEIPKHAEIVARKLLADIERPYALVADAQSRLSASLGISVFPDDAGDPQTLLKHADAAMYRAKESGKNRYCFYSLEVAPACDDPVAGRRVRHPAAD